MLLNKMIGKLKLVGKIKKIAVTLYIILYK